MHLSPQRQRIDGCLPITVTPMGASPGKGSTSEGKQIRMERSIGQRGTEVCKSVPKHSVEAGLI